MATYFPACARVFVCSFIIAAFTVGLQAAPPKVDAMFPAGVQRGSEVTIAASGAFSTWPAIVDTGHEGLKFVATAKKGQFKVTATATAELGVHWVRFHTAEGASAPRPFIVGLLPEIASKEPNDQPDAPQAITGQAVVNGKLEKSGDVDGYAVTLKQGDTLVAMVAAHRPLNSPMDAVLQICDETGFVLAQTDDDRGFDPLLAFKATTAGRYIVRLFAFPATPNSTIGFAGGASFIYRLTLATGPYITHTLPAAVPEGTATPVQLAGWNLAANAQVQVTTDDKQQNAVVTQDGASNSVSVPVVSHKSYALPGRDKAGSTLKVELPATITGQLMPGFGSHEVSFAGKKGESVRCRVEARSLFSPIDAVIELRKGGSKLKSNDDANKKPDPEFTQKLSADGQYSVVLRDLHDRTGPRFFYRMTIDRAVPEYGLTLAASEFIIPAGKELEVPVTITRLNGFKDEIEITATGLPAGVTAARVVSAASGDTAKKVTLKLTASQAAAGAFRIVGRVKEKPLLSREANFPLTDFDTTVQRLWVTAPAK